jgi:ribonucleoside-diphosphate reductase alpha chain
MPTIFVTKRNGTKEELNIDKLHKVVFFACNDINGVSPSEVEIKSQIQFYNGITSSEIQETLIKSASELISEETPNYQWVAGRLINYHLRKEVYGQYDPTKVIDLVKKNIDLGYYDPELLEWYDEQEWERIDSFVKHDRDDLLSYVAMEQMRGKYLVQNRVTKTVYETPQMCYVLIAATLFHNYPKETRLQWVKEYYDCISQHEISLPTPVMAGVRTPQRQFSSCVLIETDDSLDSINATSSAIVKYVSQKAGIGVGAGSIRAINSPIRNGDTAHTGVIPFYRLFQSAVKSCSQGGVRGGAATLYYPIWHYEVEDLLVLKNNKGTNETRIRQMDYGVQVNKLFYERLITGGDITLFSPSDVPGLYEAFYADQDEFKRLYETAERNTRLRKKVVNAQELFSAFMHERKETGRIYLQNVDNANTHSSFDEKLHPVRQSNLCAEIDLPTKPLNDINDPDGRIALCTLSAVNWGLIKTVKDFERPCKMAIRGLDALLSYQNYPVRAAFESTQDFRPLGVGIINFAYFLAKNDLSYTDNAALTKVDEFAEAWSYYLIKASADLATEQGSCRLSDETKYGKGIVPCDTRKTDIDELVPHQERMPWNELRAQLKETGIRNATTMALMPSETSAQIANATNGIEPPRSLISVKQSKDGVLKQVVPQIHKLKNKYELLWDQSSPEGYIKIVSILQKWIDQGISVNTSYNPQFYDDDKIPMSTMLQHLLMFYKYGGKQLYYFNTYDGAGEVDVDKMAQGMLNSQDKTIDDFATQEEYDEYCESCVI